MGLLNDLNELTNANVISTETAEQIRAYYQKNSNASTNRLFLVFGILGSILVGLGIILIVAHNWDNFPRTVQAFFAFLPLVIGQLICAFALLRKNESAAWRESGSAFLFFAVGAAMALISQIYNIPGNVNTFLLTWMLLCLPQIYVLRSSIASMLYLSGITYYASSVGYWTYPYHEGYWYWMLLLVALPHYYLLFKRNPKSNFLIIHHWLVPLSVIICLGTVAHHTEELMYIAYFSLFGCFYIIGHMPLFGDAKLRENAYRTLGSLGTIILLFTLSFDEFWQHLRGESFQWGESLTSPELFAAVLLTVIAAILFFRRRKQTAFSDMKPMESVFLLFIVLFFIGQSSVVAVIITNIFILGLGILTIREGARENHLGILNYGLMIITVLVICRFFDTDLSFVVRGILFIAVGVGFFVANYRMLKKRKAHG